MDSQSKDIVKTCNTLLREQNLEKQDFNKNREATMNF